VSLDFTTEQDSGGQGTDPMVIISMIRRYLWLGALVFVVVAASVTGFMMTRPKAYTATATVVLSSPDRTALQGAGSYKPGGDNDFTAYMDSKLEDAKAPQLAGQILDQFGLISDPEFAPKQNASLPLPADALRQIAIIKLEKHLKVARVGQSYMGTFAFTSRDPSKAAKLANAFANAFVLKEQQNKIDAAHQANGLLEGQLGPLREAAEKSAAAVAQYKVAHNIINLSNGPDGRTVFEDQVNNLDQQLANTRLEQTEAESHLAAAQAAIKSGASGEALGEALNSQVITNLRAQQGPLSAKLADEQERLGPKNPEIIQTQRQLNDINAQINAEVGRIMTNLQTQVNVARQRTAEVAKNLAEAQANISANNIAGVQLEQLQRDADTSRELYLAQLTKAKDTNQDQTTAVSDTAISQLATTPISPSQPNTPLAIVVGLIAGLACGALSILVRQMFDGTLRTQEEVERVLGVQYLAGIPTVRSSIKKPETDDPILAVLKHPLSGFAEAFRSLAAAVTLARPDGANVIAITSSLPNEGKTTTSICLAEVLALGGSRVIALDCDLRRRSVNASLRANAQYGLLDVIRGVKTVEEAAHIDPKSGVHFLLLPRAEAANAQSPLDLPAFDELLAQLKKTYDYVILDTPPLLPIVDTRKLAKKVDAVILLCRWQFTPKRATQHALRLLQDAGAPASGVALTRIDLKAQQRYGYGDSSYYYQGYADYYLDAPSAK